MTSNKPLVTPAIDAHLNLSQFKGTPLHLALSKVVLRVTAPGTDITHGTTFYTPVVTLLATLIGTRRQDLVYSAWPVLGCPYNYYDRMLPQIYATDVNSGRKVPLPLKQLLDTKMIAAMDGKAHVLWEVIDMLQAMCGWNLKQIIQWTRDVEKHLNRDFSHVILQLGAMADEVVARHDAEGMADKEPGFDEGVVIPASGLGRVN